MKHIDARMDWVCELRDMDAIEPVHVPTAQNKSDILTKVLEKGEHIRQVEMILHW